MAAAPKAAPVESGPSPRKTRVLVADEAGIMRDGLCALLQSDDALKTDSRAELFNAVHRVASGKGYISPSALDRMVTAYAKTADRLPGHPRPAGALTSREQEVITLIAKGYRTREMAQLMSLSHK